MSATLLEDATLLDGSGRDPVTHQSVLIEGERIAAVGPAGSIAAPDGITIIDCGGSTLMPGLTDAHVHFGLTAESQHAAPESHVSYVLKVIENIGIALDEGFTTVRDAGGLDPAFAVAVDTGQVRGPRSLPSGSFLSQTGGHGDQRDRWVDSSEPSIPGLRAHTEICDSPDAVRRAAREQIRRGATQVKLMASGGVMSPNDPLESVQFTVEEMSAAVQAARAYGKYVMAHCHTSAAINNALDAGVRSIEHASILDEQTAARLASEDAYLVPTLVVLEILARSDVVPEFSRAKLDLVRGKMAASVELAERTGVQVGSGSDLLGPRQSRRASELAERARLCGPMGAILSATKTNARLFCMSDQIGAIETGKLADLILVNGDPLADIRLLADAGNVRLVFKAGRLMKDAL